ncbi:EAL domain-containing protein [Kineothrix sp. MSJ-39]|uniref:PTS sugar transporter subunit IIC/EAL domain-containing protein n=1 Tax=Kineothrix sp. MSJ-39 TaxID=2841533 RepID=UPI001C127285|nr:EAL domain-containing protein [Kineothrix sp. MSJ-39]MBU5430537.1 EAL domain-containing protein [Kineothrix sp. MSJ-39]
MGDEAVAKKVQGMENLQKHIMNITDKLENSCVVGAIRQGMIMMIPLLVVGYMAAMLINLPIPAFQKFLSELWGGCVRTFLESIYISVNDFFAVYLTIATSVSYSMMKRRKKGIYESTGNVVILVIITLAAFAAYAGIQYETFSIARFSNMYAFSALVVSLISGSIYYALKESHFLQAKRQRTNTDNVYIGAVEGILPAVIIIGFFVLLRQILYVAFGVNGLQELLEMLFNFLLKPLKNGLGAGLIVILLTHGLWFFGIHGHNMLDAVIKQNFTDVTAGIFSKTMQDVFVLLGGAGAMLCLLIAILLFAKKKGVRHLAGMAAPSVLFNISEIALFGIPVILNPIFLIPFLLVPVSNFLLSYAAIYFGLVPHVIREIDWTTPIFLSGYKATGSWAGVILQVVCLVVGVLIYKPFVRLYEEQNERRMRRDVKRLVEEMQREEENNAISYLTKREDDLGHTARILAADLVDAVQKKELFLVYQPQVNCEEVCVGVEALIRWKHPELGFIYPPLIIQLAKEKKVLHKLEEYIIDEAANVLSGLEPLTSAEFKVSVNITNESLAWEDLEKHIAEAVEKYKIPSKYLCLEITEQDALSSSVDVADKIRKLKARGHRFLIDDFGMGHTSLMYLQTNYFDVVKLDGALTRDVLTNERNSDIIASIVYLGKSLHFKIIAEYVETEEQRDKLKELGCDAFQGYLYSKPLELDELIGWLKQYK